MFSRAPIRTFSSELFHTTYYIYSLEKCENESNMLGIILVQGSFCPLKIKITQFPNGFHLNLSLFPIIDWGL